MGVRSGRIYLRQWHESDFVAFARLNADRRVMEFFPGTLTHDESEALARKMMSLIDQRGWGVWALEIPEVTGFAGFVGLNVPEDDLPFRPCVEIAWRLAFDHWGKGYATEAAKAALKFGFVNLGLDEIVAFTATANKRSQRVMQRLGMTSAGTGFEHPALDPTHPLRPHVLYKMANQNKS